MKKYRANLIAEFEYQFNYLNSNYLNNSNKVAERKVLVDSVQTARSKPRAESAYHGSSKYLLIEEENPPDTAQELWPSEPNLYSYLIKDMNVLNAYALDEFAIARFHHNRKNH